MRALVVDDEPGIVRIVSTYLEREGFSVVSAHEGEQAIESARAVNPDVIVLDLMLPGIDGIEVCRRIREFSDAYVIMLTAKAEDVDAIVGLSSGADDYLTKPFSPGELVARVRALLRRPRQPDPAHAGRRVFGELEIDPMAHEARLRSRMIDLTPLEFALLETLSGEPRVAFTRDQLLERVWGRNWFGDGHVVDVHIANLRRKLGDDSSAPRFVRTVRGVGYRMGEG